MLKGLQKKGHKKPLLTSYISSYNPENDPEGRVKVPWLMNFDRFIPEGAVFFLPATIPGWEEMTEPIPGRFYSAHFAFSLGSFVKEVPHDPEYYFHGEEISIAVRAFTHGYDLFHPHQVVIWHYYTRSNQPRHWTDSKDWVKLDSASHTKVRKLLGIDGEKLTKRGKNKYGLGTERSLKEYEKYAGVLFKKRQVQQYTLDCNYPPNPSYSNDSDYTKSFLSYFLCHLRNVNFLYYGKVQM